MDLCGICEEFLWKLRELNVARLSAELRGSTLVSLTPFLALTKLAAAQTKFCPFPQNFRRAIFASATKDAGVKGPSSSEPQLLRKSQKNDKLIDEGNFGLLQMLNGRNFSSIPSDVQKRKRFDAIRSRVSISLRNFFWHELKQALKSATNFFRGISQIYAKFRRKWRNSATKVSLCVRCV